MLTEQEGFVTGSSAINEYSFMCLDGSWQVKNEQFTVLIS